MAGYSRENERQNKALKSILRGETPEKRIFVAQEDLEFKKKFDEEAKEEQKRIDEKLEITKEARMPWFCPECEKVMKRRLDNKMWYLHGHCFDCQVKTENEMRIKGTYDEWAEKKVIANKLAWIKEQKQGIKEFKEQKAPTIFNQINPDGHSVEKEKWDVNREKIIEQADEALEHLQKIEDSLL
tara:strand:+ start:46 stop:597 length:552 start_codon:yes stop_codon:yes gene_type:complete